MGILHLPIFPDDFELLRGKNSLTTYTFGTDVAQQPFCSHSGIASSRRRRARTAKAKRAA
jgi:hypothetical protein